MPGNLMVKLAASMLAIIRTHIVPVNEEGFATETPGDIVVDIEESIVPRAAAGAVGNICLQIELATDSH